MHYMTGTIIGLPQIAVPARELPPVLGGLRGGHASTGVSGAAEPEGAVAGLEAVFERVDRIPNHQIIGTVTLVSGCVIARRSFRVGRPVVIRLRVMAEVMEIGLPVARTALRAVNCAVLLVLGGSLVGTAVCFLTACVK
jgi:hypothetical protein